MTERFALAPMSAAMWILTVVCWLIPPTIAGIAWSAPAPARGLLVVVAVAVVAIYASVGLWMRPLAFVVGADALEIVWPLRRRRIERAAIVRARVLELSAIKAELGYMMRIGAGGLWGGFGLARTGRGTLELWVSRTDRMVWIECAGRRGLLVTPVDPDRFAAALAQP